MSDEVSDEYAVALAAHNNAVTKYTEAWTAYRALKIGDTEFLTAKKEYDVATKAFDDAYAKEARRAA